LSSDNPNRTRIQTFGFFPISSSRWTDSITAHYSVIHYPRRRIIWHTVHLADIPSLPQSARKLSRARAYMSVQHSPTQSILGDGIWAHSPACASRDEIRPGPHYGLWSMDPVSHARPSTLSPVSYCSTHLPLRIGGLVGLGTPRAQGCPAMDWVMVQPATSWLRVHLSTSCPRQVAWLVFKGIFSTDRLYHAIGVNFHPVHGSWPRHFWGMVGSKHWWTRSPDQIFARWINQ